MVSGSRNMLNVISFFFTLAPYFFGVFLYIFIHSPVIVNSGPIQIGDGMHFCRCDIYIYIYIRDHFTLLYIPTNT